MHESVAKRAQIWLLLKSGEILRGRIEYIRGEKVHFDSDELEDLDVAWGYLDGSRVAVQEFPRDRTDRANVNEGADMRRLAVRAAFAALLVAAPSAAEIGHFVSGTLNIPSTRPGTASRAIQWD